MKTKKYTYILADKIGRKIVEARSWTDVKIIQRLIRKQIMYIVKDIKTKKI
jgi:hypothetical protein